MGPGVLQLLIDFGIVYLWILALGLLSRDFYIGYWILEPIILN